MNFLCPGRDRSSLHAVRVVREQVDPHRRRSSVVLLSCQISPFLVEMTQELGASPFHAHPEKSGGSIPC
jgi:hypothetical protein